MSARTAAAPEAEAGAHQAITGALEFREPVASRGADRRAGGRRAGTGGLNDAHRRGDRENTYHYTDDGQHNRAAGTAGLAVVPIVTRVFRIGVEFILSALVVGLIGECVGQAHGGAIDQPHGAPAPVPGGGRLRRATLPDIARQIRQ